MTRLTRTLSHLLSAVALLGFVAAPAAALSLDEAKSKGLLGERSDGYVGVVDGGSDAAKKLAKDVNRKRRKRYQEIADQRGASVEDVAALAGAKLVKRASSGEYVNDGSGWTKK